MRNAGKLERVFARDSALPRTIAVAWPQTDVPTMTGTRNRWMSQAIMQPLICLDCGAAEECIMRILAASTLLTATISWMPPQAAPLEMCDGRPPIQREQIELMFGNIRAETSWDISGPMLWGYFFKDEKKSELEKLKDKLVIDGYRFVRLIRSNGWFLHVEKIEAHSPETLHNRNLALYTLAAQYNVDCYDGMDVGPVSEG
jgi:hypothetical protein